MAREVVVVGGGVIGLSIARELAISGRTVTLLDRGTPAREASWAGAGMLPPGNSESATTPFRRLRAASHQLWPDISDALRDTTGIDNGYRQCGALEVRIGDEAESLADEVFDWAGEGCAVQQLTASELLDFEPALTPTSGGGYRLSEFSQVRNPRHLKALLADCERLGVDIRCGQSVRSFERAGDRILSVKADSDVFRGEQFVLAAGAWSQALLSDFGVSSTVHPVLGQIVLLKAPATALKHVVQVGKRYLVPRGDGLILVGATEERVGFHKRNTAAAISDLIQFAIRIVPSLATADVVRTWAGLRPGSDREVPILGQAGTLGNLSLAIGHFRDGLQLSAITGRLLRQMLNGEPTSIDCEPYRL